MSLRSLRCLSVTLAAGAAVLLTGCFEQPVSETMYLKFLPDSDGVVVGVHVVLGSVKSFEDSAAARQRIEALQRDLLEEHDPWSKRFRRLDPVLDRVVRDRTEGSLARATLQGYAENPENLRQFFSDSLIEARVDRQESSSELTLAVGNGSRATRTQREELRQALDPWIASLERYLRAGTRFYGFLEQNPELAEAGFARLFDSRGPGGVKPSAPRAASGAASDDPQEQVLLLSQELKDSLEEVLLVFQVSSDTGISLQELSSLVYDPFPAPLTVQVPGRIAEVEGFRRSERGLLEAGGTGILLSLQGLEGKWLDPEPLMEEYRALAGGAPVDSQALAHRPRRFMAPPTTSDLRSLLEKSLSGPQIYRVRWATPPAPEGAARRADLEWLWSDPSAETP
jgi:hypothetical protein